MPLLQAEQTHEQRIGLIRRQRSVESRDICGE
jgi:hypothetical protein